MDLYEYQARDVFEKHGVPVLQGIVATTPAEARAAPEERGGTVDVKAKGQMTLHGKTKEVPFAYKATCNAAGVCDATGSAALNINDFGIIIPSYLGVTMKPDVTIDTKFQVKK